MLDVRLLLSGGLLMATPQLLATNRIRKWGGSYVVSLTKEVRKALGVKDGDDVAFRKIGRYVVVAVVHAFAVAPVSSQEVKQARAALGV